MKKPNLKFPPDPAEPIFQTRNIRNKRGWVMRDSYEERVCAMVEVTGDEYDKAWQAEKWTSQMKTDYGKPIPYQGSVKRYQGIDMKGAFGNIGEVAWGKLSGLEVNLEYIKGGDKFDFDINGLKTNVKTAFPKRKPWEIRGPSIAAVIDDVRQPVHDLYIAGFVAKDFTEEQRAQVVFVGYIGKHALLEHSYVDSKWKNTLNYDLWFYEMVPITEIL